MGLVLRGLRSGFACSPNITESLLSFFRVLFLILHHRYRQWLLRKEPYLALVIHYRLRSGDL